MAEVDTSIYKNAISQNPLEVATKATELQNKLLGNVQGRQAIEQGDQAIQANNIKLATERFGMINNAASGLLSDPELGKQDITKRLTDTLGRLTAGDAMTAQHAVQFLQQFPKDPAGQRQAIQAVHAQTLGAWEKGKAYIGELTARGTGGGTNFLREPAFGGAPQDTGKYLPNTVAAGTPNVNNDQNSPQYGQTEATGGQGAPRLQDSMPSTPIAPARPKVAGSSSVMGDDEAIARGVYPSAQPGVRPVTTSLAPDEGAAMKGGADAYDAAMVAGGKYAQRVNPLRQAIPLLEKMKETEIGPTSDKWNDIKSTAVSLGAGPLLGIDPEKIKNLNELKKYFNQYASQAAATLGPKTNDGLATAVTSNPNIHMDKLSATDLSKVAMGIERMQQAAALEFNDKVQKGQAKPGSFSRFMLKFGTEQDPRAFVYDIMDKKAQDAVRKLPEAERAKVAEGMRIAEKWKLLGDVHRE